MLYTPHDIAGLAKGALVIGPFGSDLKTSDYRDEGVPLVFVKDIRAEDFSRPRAHVSTAKAAELEAHQVLPGDILITKMGDPPGDVALYDSDVPGIITADCIRLRPTGGFDRKYLVHSLRTLSARRQIDAITTGAAQKKVSLDRFRTRLHISAPPLAEQKRIAAVLDQVDVLRTRRREAIALLDDLARSIFLDMFGNPATNPKGLGIGRVGDLLESSTYGTSAKADAEGEVPVLRMNNVTVAGDIDMRHLKYLPGPSVPDRHMVRAGDVLFNRTNSAELVGKTAIYRRSESVAYAGYLVRLRVSRDHDPEYLAAFLNSGYAKRVLRSMCKSIVGMANINAKEVQGIRIPIPSLVEQKRFAAAITAIEAAKVPHRAHLATLDELFTSLQQRAFSGRLWEHEAA